jgi:2-oxoglutarate dehydrogenase E1 component
MSTNFANSLNADLIDQNYSLWSRDPQSVDSYWAAFFEGFELGCSTDGAAPSGAGEEMDTLPLQTRVEALVYGYRTLGHTIAKVDPLSTARPEQPLLELEEFGFSEKDLDLTVSSKFFEGGRPMKLREMIAALEAIYAGPIGAEFMHIQNIRVRNWVRERLEARTSGGGVDPESQKRILRTLLEAESFEHFLDT